MLLDYYTLVLVKQQHKFFVFQDNIFPDMTAPSAGGCLSVPLLPQGFVT